VRTSHRTPEQLRNIKFTRHYTKYAEGSVLVEFGETKVLCNATVAKGVPRFLKDSSRGWLTAEYSMLPRSTHDRMDREASRGKQGGRTLEIQRLIGRSLRAAVNLNLLNDLTITVDCDVIQADGGTRTAAITGGYVALVDAVAYLQKNKKLTVNPIKHMIASVSVGIYKGVPILDLDYQEDSDADTDMNVVMNEQNEFIELQGTAEKNTFHQSELMQMLNLAKSGIAQLITHQKAILEMNRPEINEEVS